MMKGEDLEPIRSSFQQGRQVEAAEQIASATTIGLPLLPSLFIARRSERKAGFNWSNSWIPAIILLLSDFLSWPALFLLFSQIRSGFVGTPGQIEWQILLVPPVISTVMLHVVGGYDRRTKMLALAYSVEHLVALAIALVLADVALYGFVAFYESVKPSRLIFFLNFLPYFAHTLATRRWVAAVLYNHRSHHHFVLVADYQTAASFCQQYRKRRMPQELKICIFGPQVPVLPVSSERGACFLGSLNEALANLDEQCDGVIIGISPSKLDPNLIQLLANLHFQQIPVYTLESFHEVLWRQVPADRIEGWWAFARESLLARNSIYDQIKRLFDVFAALIALPFLLPLWLLVSLLVRLDSPGPAIFRQVRIGRDGRPFVLYKFRTMRIGSQNGSIYTAKRDPRITRLGHFLRRTRIDELPQLLNVILGDMSIIGPRAEWIKCVERYEGSIPFYSYRHFVRPGITGWAQVNYPYGESDLDALEKLKFDLYYIRNYSLFLDVAILLKTLHLVVFAKGR
jgi:exopolysaccharide biosynthesis polyprenyl glycosylphosphotransferase